MWLVLCNMCWFLCVLGSTYIMPTLLLKASGQLPTNSLLCTDCPHMDSMLLITETDSLFEILPTRRHHHKTLSTASIFLDRVAIWVHFKSLYYQFQVFTKKCTHIRLYIYYWRYFGSRKAQNRSFSFGWFPGKLELVFILVQLATCMYALPK